jgi:hypothetical protein
MTTATPTISASTAQHLAHSNLISVFSNRDPSSRLSAAHQTYHPTVEFYQPTPHHSTEVSIGIDAVVACAEAVLAERPGWAFATVGNVKVTGTTVFLAWKFGPVDERGNVEGRSSGADVIFVEGGLIRRFWVLIDGLSDVEV